MKHRVFLGLGSNLGDRQHTLCHAYDEIERLIGPIVARSAFYTTHPWGFQSDHDFLNSVVCCETVCTPQQVLIDTQQIERWLGRKQKSTGGVYLDRPIDIDILLYDNLQVATADLQIPHPLMLERDFVMMPLLEVFSLLNPYFTPPFFQIRSSDTTISTDLKRNHAQAQPKCAEAGRN